MEGNLYIPHEISKVFLHGECAEKFGVEAASSVSRLLARRADSIFLWAQISAITYAYTPNERAEIINKEKSFKVLGKLFEKILDDLDTRVVKSQREKVRKVFEWLVASQQP